MSAKIRIFDENGDEQPFSKFRMKEELRGHGNPANLLEWALARTGFFRASDLKFSENEITDICNSLNRTKDEMYDKSAYNISEEPNDGL